MKHALLDYERNGYDDSDFLAVYFNSETNQIEQSEIGSTRYAGGINFGDITIHKGGCPADILELARQALAIHIFNVIKAAELRDVLEPQNAKHGDMMRVLRDSRKGAKNQFKAGDTGDVFWVGAFGTFYKNGFKQPGRSNRSIGLRRLDGTRFFVPLSACRMDREPLTDAELTERAEELSRHYNFGAAVGGYTWASNYYFKNPSDQKS
jgi:hypothetical protein